MTDEEKIIFTKLLSTLRANLMECVNDFLESEDAKLYLTRGNFFPLIYGAMLGGYYHLLGKLAQSRSVDATNTINDAHAKSVDLASQTLQTILRNND